MKVCPKCHSAYSDETLNFCLTDGVPLVVEEVYQERLSSPNTWQEAETLHDSRFAAAVGQHTTSPNSVAPTFTSASSQKTATFSTEPPKKSSKTMLFSVVGILAALGVGAALFWRSAGEAGNADNSPTAAVPTATVLVKKAAVPLTAQQQDQVKKEVSDTLAGWVATNSKKNIDAHIAHYADTLEIYYGESGKDKNHVRADRLRAYQRYDSIQMQVDNLQIAPESEESASVVFDKSWTMKNAQKTSTGSVQQEMHLVKLGGKWLIIGEKDLKVYYINNRENQPANAEPSANTSNSAPNDSR